MTTGDIIQIIREVSLHLKLDLREDQLQSAYFNQRTYELDDIFEFKRDLIEAARKCGLFILEYSMPASKIESRLRESKDAFIVFISDGEKFKPDVLVHLRSKVQSLFSGGPVDLSQADRWLPSDSGEIVILTVIPYKEVVGQDPVSTTPLSPTKRLFKLFSTEKKDISYILIYALFIGLLSLVLPLGLQSTIEFISGGVFFSSVYILIGLVILGVLATGVLQMVQISIVEQLQRRVFVKAALEFTYRIPRIRLEALTKSYAPELVNRFFDIITI